MRTLSISDQNQMRRCGQALGKRVQAGDVLALTGALGTGKTFFVRALGEGMNLQEPVTSPTFALIQEYHGPIPLIHIDAYRLDDAAAAATLGLEEYFARPAVFAVEWADRIATLLPEERLEIYFEAPLPEQELRLLHLQAKGERAVALLEMLERTVQHGQS
ncbi:MAG TPA: tRNA (adenosine(37)-N6)-threonylcarbamoyltransferase complex ATPase subunit type 1 TsaE [Chthonomonas sp.]|uniref:tRNA (adenosine(37)-N6)-threonylcarbamoyltransferase complex ATPase subunit type 1 TsaE n=1 Tax=Chthonomonas sp. TaxID=2282153 RepID=UPI002B4B5B27|nr:tRNA (adenosine(37)-N6)-threonylcarbamoyltransferase complex ATPase subunit type 1 TsaE [Chthonomonas sp.]HLI48577.1 tRNA (adenosine(37)-N6)-threonylcarbamoyltransferase complex ATPase subunit type 1 TsaE [Chthonomonas sp.]